MNSLQKRRDSQSGQAVIEYILLLSIVVIASVLLKNFLQKQTFSTKLIDNLKNEFARSYRYGHPMAKGFDNDAPYSKDGPSMHPRIVESGNFRIFYNPRAGGGDDSGR